MSASRKLSRGAVGLLGKSICTAILLAGTAYAAEEWAEKVAEFVNVVEQSGRLREADRLRKQLVAGGDAAVQAMMEYLRTSPEPKPSTWGSVIGCITRSRAESSTAALAELLVKGRGRQRQTVAKSLAWRLKHRMGQELIPPLKKALADPIPIVRVNAAVALKRRGDESGLDVLLREAEEPWAEASRLAQGCLGTLPWRDKERIVESALRQLKSLDRNTRSGARGLARRLKAPELKAAAEASKRKEVEETTDIRNLGKRGDDPAVQMLVRLMARTREQRLVARALMAAGSRKAVNGLIELLDSRTNAVRKWSGIVLRRLTGEIFGSHRKDLWKAWWAEHRDEYLANPALPYPGPTAEQARRARELLGLINDRKAQREALAELAKLGPGVILVIRQHLLAFHRDHWMDGQGGNREALLPLLAKMGKPGLDELGRLAVLEGSHKWIRTAAWAALVRADRKAAADFGLRVLKDGQPPLHLARALEECWYAEQAPALRRAIHDERTPESSKRIAVRGVAKVEGRNAIPFLAGIVREQKYGDELRFRALGAIAELDAERVGPLLAGVLGSLQLRALGWRMEQLVKKYPQQVVPVLERFRDGDGPEDQRVEVACVLVKLRHPGAVKAIVPFLRSKNERAQATALRAFADGGAGPVLAEIEPIALGAKSADVRRSAVGVLRRTGKREVIPTLIKVLKDPKPRVVGRALEALDELTDLRFARGLRSNAQFPAAAARYTEWWHKEGHKPTAIEEAWEKRFWAEFDELVKHAKPPVGKELRPELLVPLTGKSSLGIMLQYNPGLCLAAFAPAARHVAFLREREGGFELVLVNPKRRKARKLGPMLPFCMAFSPSGRSLAMAAVAMGPRRNALLVKVDLDSGKTTRLIEMPIGPGKGLTTIPSCTWLSEGLIAAYVVKRGVPRIIVYDTTTGRQTELANLAEAAKRIPSTTPVQVDPRWTPRGEYLSASATGDIYACWAGRVFRVNATTRKTECVMDPTFRGGLSNPRVNRSGRAFLVQGGQDANAYFFTRAADGSFTRTLAVFELRAPHLTEHFANWFPDGRYLAVTTLRSIRLCTEDGNDKVSIPMPEDASCVGVWPVSSDALVILSRSGFWRIHVAAHLRKLAEAALRRKLRRQLGTHPPRLDEEEPED